MKAISIRQPWAWLIVASHKDIENRTWSTSHRGETFIHASSTLTRREYDEAVYYVNHILGLPIQIPRREELPLGGIIGSVDLFDCVPPTSITSQWHIAGAFGFAVRSAKRLPFVPMTGRLGLFDLTPEAEPYVKAALATASLEERP
ncbi:ASCH domain-containing protein [Burkholderia gladioli]|uniref:Gp69 n=1 Tax=Burkholderia gladioli (strain BSR3) TaxID=999541 RepID=F2L9I7_BURGS|nr:ASCH domain-containing protein [Burkholderia gladioli]AEA59750.1 gp69 [Burkholderia gladioli BSR3]